MDNLEQRGMSEGASSADPGDFVRSGITNTPDSAAQTQAMQESSTDANSILENPNDNPQLEANRKAMQAQHTRRQQSLATKERELERQIAIMQAQTQSVQSVTQQQQIAAQEPNTPADWMGYMPEQYQDNPDVRQLVGSMQKAAAAETAAVNEQLRKLAEQNQQLQSQVVQQGNTQLQQNLTQQAQVVAREYGSFLTQEQAAQVVQRGTQTGNLKSALIEVAPNVIEMKARADALAHVNQQRQSSWPAGLNGMNDETVGAAPKETYQPGESMAETAKRALGAVGFSQALRDGLE